MFKQSRDLSASSELMASLVKLQFAEKGFRNYFDNVTYFDQLSNIFIVDQMFCNGSLKLCKIKRK